MRSISLLSALLALVGVAQAEPTKLVVWGMESNAESKDMDARIAEFERRNPGIDVSVLSMGAGGMNPQKLMTAIVGGVPPDLVQQDRFTIGDWASRGAFRSLDDLLAAEPKDDSLTVRKADYVPATWAEAVYEGKTFAIPNTTDVRYLFYNKALFRKAGLDPERPPQTWDEMIAAAKRMTVRTPSGGLEQIGLIPAFSQGWLYLWSWQMGGEVMTPDGRKCTLDNPQTVAALAALVGWYDELGGVNSISTFAGGFGSEEQDPFLSGKLAMRVDGDGFLNVIARFKPDLDFGVVPAPVPRDRFEHKGAFKDAETWVTWSGGHSFAIPEGSRHVPEAWAFIRWVNSPEAALIGAKAQAAYARGKGRLYVPSLLANLKASDAVFAEYRDSLPPKYRAAKDTAQALLPDTKFRPVTFVGQRLWDEQVRAVDRATRHIQSPEEALKQAQRVVQGELDAAHG
ncbi:ABC transporter substrate-binding protein, partial [bacterium]